MPGHISSSLCQSVKSFSKFASAPTRKTMGLNQSRQLKKQLSEACAKADLVGSTQMSKFLGDTVCLPGHSLNLTVTHDDSS